MNVEETVELQRKVRSRLQRARQDLADPHAVGVTAATDLRAVSDNLQDFRQSMPLLAELGNTLGEAVTLIESLCEQVASLKAQQGGPPVTEG